MKGPLLSSYKFHPALTLALDAATAQAREWKQDYLGVEHLLLGILETESPDGPGTASLALLGLSPESVLAKLLPAAAVPADRAVPRAIPFTPRSLLVLDSAADLARKAGCAQVDAGHIIHAILEERESLAAWALAEACSDFLTASVADLPPPHRAFHEWLLVAHGAAWELPHVEEPGILAALRKCGRLHPVPPDLSLVVQDFLVEGWIASTRLTATNCAGAIRLLVSLGSSGAFSRGRLNHRLAAKISRSLTAIPGSNRISRKVFLSGWPETAVDRAGRLERSRFCGKSPVHGLRAWQTSDEGASFKLFQALEVSGQIPSGHFANYLLCLRDPDGISLVIEQADRLVATATALVRMGDESSVQVPPALSLAFGLVRPECQSNGLGLTLIAARLWLAVHLQRKYVHLEATARSRPWLARLGFRFILHTTEIGTFFHGTLLLEDEAGDFLEAWLGSENVAFLAGLAARFRENTSPDCSEESNPGQNHVGSIPLGLSDLPS